MSQMVRYWYYRFGLCIWGGPSTRNNEEKCELSSPRFFDWGNLRVTEKRIWKISELKNNPAVDEICGGLDFRITSSWGL